MKLKKAIFAIGRHPVTGQKLYDGWLPTGTEVLPGEYFSCCGYVRVEVRENAGFHSLEECNTRELVEALGLTSGKQPVEIGGWYGDLRFEWRGGRPEISEIRVPE